MKNNPRILVAVCSHAANSTSREMVRQTWASNIPDGITVRFFVGGKGDRIEPDTVMVDAFDTYEYVPSKVRKFFALTLTEEDLVDTYDWIFKCDDDTYIDLMRLGDLTLSGYEHVGDEHYMKNRKAASGGAGYLLSKRLVEIIAADDTLADTGYDDLVISGAINQRYPDVCGCSSRLRYDYKIFPHSQNDLITAHWLSPRRMEAVYTVNNCTPDSFTHLDYADVEEGVAFYSNGVCAKQIECRIGCWEIKDDKLFMMWHVWEGEVNLVLNKK